jgi:hypothetical protein
MVNTKKSFTSSEQDLTKEDLTKEDLFKTNIQKIETNYPLLNILRLEK